MSFTPKAWQDLPTELQPQTNETVAAWFARISVYDAAHPGTLTPIDAAALVDLETRLSQAGGGSASATIVAPFTGVVSTDVQAALEEIVAGLYDLVEDPVNGYPARGTGGPPRTFRGWSDPTSLMEEGDRFIPIPQPA